MEIEVTKDEKALFQFKLKGETHTLLNLLSKELFKDSSIDFAGYNVDHPLINEATVSVSGKNPKKSIKEAVARLQKEIKDFKSLVKKA